MPRGFPGVNRASPAGDEQRHDAFTRYVLPEVEVLLRAARAITRDPGEAEDLTQETLLRAFRAVDRFDGRHPRAWLLTIMRNTQLNLTRRKRPHLLRDPAVAEEPARDPRGDPEATVVGETFEAVVVDAFASLPAHHRRLVSLVDISGLSYKEAATVLGVPVGTVMSGLHRARSRIRRRLVAAGMAPSRRDP